MSYCESCAVSHGYFPNSLLGCIITEKVKQYMSTYTRHDYLVTFKCLFCTNYGMNKGFLEHNCVHCVCTNNNYERI